MKSRFFKIIDDPYGYDKHIKKRAFIISTAFLVLIWGFAACRFCMLLPAPPSSDARVIAKALDFLAGLISKDLLDVNFSASHAIAWLILMGAVIVALFMLQRSHKNDEEYSEVYYRIPDFYTKEQKEAAKTVRKKCVISAIVLACAGTAVCAAVSGLNKKVFEGCVMLFCGAAVWLLLYGNFIGTKTNVFNYNFHAIKYVNEYAIQKDDKIKSKKTLLGEKHLRDKLILKKQIVVIISVLAALALFELPTIETPFYWVALVIGFAVCLFIEHRGRIEAQEKYESQSEE